MKGKAMPRSKAFVEPLWNQCGSIVWYFPAAFFFTAAFLVTDDRGALPPGPLAGGRGRPAENDT